MQWASKPLKDECSGSKGGSPWRGPRGRAPSSITLGAEFNVEGLISRDWNILKNYPKSKRVTYVSMKFSRFKKLGPGFDMFMKDKDTC
ncbi:hypothetical protein OROMI_011612 [Orobanche minor]